MIRVPITRPALGDAEIGEVTRVVKSGWITQGPEVVAFEKEFAAAVGAKNAIAVSNCTVAIELALRVVGVTREDDVVTVSHSFIATANAIVAVGGRPVFCDVEEDTFGMDPHSLERSLTPRTKAILCVHQIGIPCDLESILAIGKKHGIPVIEDAACAIGSEWNGKRIGAPDGALACFSFHPRKIVTTGDGGMITTQDDAFATRLRLLRQHAMSVPDTVRHHSDKVVFEEYTEPAFNYRMTDLQASVGRPQLARLADIVSVRRKLAEKYREALEGNRMFAAPVDRPNAKSNWQSYPLRLKTGKQIDVMQALVDRGIACKRGISNSHQEPAYAGKSFWGMDGHGLAVSESLRDTTILVPLFHGMSDAEQTLVIDSLKDISK
jgi:dTDP-4-amino-4,6-dideoxygalactose transaminase